MISLPQHDVTSFLRWMIFQNPLYAIYFTPGTKQRNSNRRFAAVSAVLPSLSNPGETLKETILIFLVSVGKGITALNNTVYLICSASKQLKDCRYQLLESKQSMELCLSTLHLSSLHLFQHFGN